MLSIFTTTLVTLLSAPQDPPPKDADFPRMGEYVGSLEVARESLRFGVQVIALGQGVFEGVAYRGGLPGQGWDGQTPQRHQGRLHEGKVTFLTRVFKAHIENGALHVIDHRGREYGTLAKLARRSPTLGATPPRGARVLFDGTSTAAWRGRGNAPARMTEDGLLMQGCTTVATFEDFDLHLEFRLPYMPRARGQGRGNSGLYLQGRYEVQILDSFGLSGQANECGGIYGVRRPDLNMCYPPMTWQTYDLEFRAPRYDPVVSRLRGAVLTVRHNGTVIHHEVEVKAPTRAAVRGAGKDAGPIFLQDHGNEVRFRNIWVLEKPR